MNYLWQLLWFVVAVGLLVAIHEFGHFWVARKLGFKVLRFSVGFGKPLLKKIGRGPDKTEYVLAAIPLGGYVKMLGEQDDEYTAAEQHRAFNRKPPWQRILVLLAGPAANIIFAVAVLWAMMWYSGLTFVKPLVGEVRSGSLAAEAGLRSGDEVIGVAGDNVTDQRDVLLGLLDAMSSSGEALLTVRGEDGSTRSAALRVVDQEVRRGLTEPGQLLSGLGLSFWRPPVPPVVGMVSGGSAAAAAGLQAGDRIVAIDGQRIQDFDALRSIVSVRPGADLAIRYERDGGEQSVRLTVGTAQVDGKTVGLLGITPHSGGTLPESMIKRVPLSAFAALGNAADEAWRITALQARFFGRMLLGDVSLKNLSGPVTIGQFAGESASQGVAPFLQFLVLISLSLGFLNLLPIPILDGGQIVYQTIEWIKGGPMSERAQAFGQQVGIGLLVLLMGLALFNDFSRTLFGGMILSKVSLVVALALGAAVVVLPAQAQISSAPVSPDPISSDQMAPEQITPAFRVGDIRVEGLQRVSEGTVYNYLPVNIGDRLTAQRIREAIRALYETGFFRDVEMRRDGETLLVVVRERPTIESFELKGNKDIKTEDLNKSLRNVGLAQGKTFDRSVLEEVTAFLQDQYGSRGKYAARVKTEVEELADNRVKVKIDIVEGKRAKIRQVNIVGNDTFSDKEVRDEFELRTPNWLSWYRQDDRYSRESLQGDLEKLRSFYMDRGYANFQVESVQVAIAPTKDDIFITANIDEGEVFKVKDVKLAGNFVVPEEELRRYLLVGPGTTYSRKVITATQELLQNRLGEDGYAFAKVDPVATAAGEKDSNELSINFVIEPGNRVYVRHIAFEGANKINDEVLRREMRQMEGAWLSNLSLERSKQRLQRLPYIKSVESETKPVPGVPDMVDVVYNVEEGPSAQLGGGIGYSESQSFILNGNYADSNFMGTGRRIAVDLNSGRFSKVYGLSVTEPYFTKDGIALTGSLTYRDVTQFVSASSDFSSETIAGGFDIGYPISEFQGVRFGLSYQRADLLTSSGSAQQAIDWVQSNGSPRTTVLEPILDDSGIPIPGTGPFTFFGTRFNTLDFTAGWSFDSRNRALFATRGTRHTLSLSYTVPGISDVEYFVANYEFLKYVPLFGRFALSLGGEVGYGMDVGDTTALPPFRQFFAGGPDTVRGYRESRLGPKDQFGNPYGGNLKVVGRAELILPMPQKWASSARLSWFYDMGNIFSVGDRVAFTGRFDALTGQPGPPIEYGFKYDKLKHSTGLAVQWLAPLGIFRFSYAVPLNAYAGDGVVYEDEQERFQFSIGQAF